ncbi:hypothetical protein K466DRAFT_491687, partial [Polyporus arcularius HHB13444]
FSATGNRAIAPTLWPGGLGRSETCGIDLQVRDDWRYIPETLDDMCEWAAVGCDDVDDPTFERDRRYLLYHPSVVPTEYLGVDCRVTVVLQGFLGAFQLSTLGNWKGREKDAARAVQYLVLESGGCTEAFQAQTRALENLKRFICMKVGSSANDREYGGDSIYLERLVFTKVRAVSDRASFIELDDRTDPRRNARKIAHRWGINHVVQTGARRANGENTSIALEALRVGDFVEVSVSADITAVRRGGRGGGGGGTVVRFGMHEVVRLWTAEEAQVWVVGMRMCANAHRDCIHRRVGLVPTARRRDAQRKKSWLRCHQGSA